MVLNGLFFVTDCASLATDVFWSQAYLNAIRPTGFRTAAALYVACITKVVSNALVFIGTFVLFMENNDIADLLLNCVALTFCATAATDIAQGQLLEPLGKVLQTSSKDLDELIESHKDSDIAKEWRHALENESTVKAFLYWPLEVSARGLGDWIMFLLINGTRCLGIVLTCYIPSCM